MELTIPPPPEGSLVSVPQPGTLPTNSRAGPGFVGSVLPAATISVSIIPSAASSGSNPPFGTHFQALSVATQRHGGHAPPLPASTGTASHLPRTQTSAGQMTGPGMPGSAPRTGTQMFAGQMTGSRPVGSVPPSGTSSVNPMTASGLPVLFFLI